MKKWAVIIILAIALLDFVQTSNATPVVWEGELITTWAGDGTDAAHQAKVNIDYDLLRCQQRDASNPPAGTLKIYFKATKTVLDKMISDGCDILWSHEFVEEQE